MTSLWNECATYTVWTSSIVKFRDIIYGEYFGISWYCWRKLLFILYLWEIAHLTHKRFVGKWWRDVNWFFHYVIYLNCVFQPNLIPNWADIISNNFPDISRLDIKKICTRRKLSLKTPICKILVLVTTIDNFFDVLGFDRVDK